MTTATTRFGAGFVDLLLNGDAEAIFVVSYPDRIVRACSDGVAHVLGYQPAELIGRPTGILHVDAESHREFGEILRGEVVEGKVFRGQYRIRHRDGRVLETMHQAVPIFDESGSVRGNVSIVRDMSSERFNRRLLNLIIDAVPVAIAVNRADDGGFLLANAMCSEMLGLAAGEPVADGPAKDFYADPEDRKRLIDVLQRGGSVSGVEVHLRRGDDSLFWASVSMRLLPFLGEQVVFATFLDTTAERAARDAEQRIRRQLEAIVDNAPAYIFLKDRERRYILQNRRHREDRARAGVDPDDRHSYRLHSAEGASRLAALDDEVLWTGSVVTDELTVERKGVGRRTIRATKFPVFDEDGTVAAIGGFCLDVTEQHELQERLRHAQKIEAMGQLTGGIAHDFNNLLEVILGNSEMLIEDLADDPAKRRMAELVRKAAERAAALTHRMLAFSRQQDLHPDNVDCGRLIGSLTRMLKRTVGEDIELITEFAPEVWPVWVDRGELEACLINLVVNARDAMPSGGPIRLRTENVALEAAPIRDLPPGDYVRLSVADSGNGMSPEVLARAFDPYFTTKDVGRGTGLGLSMVHGFVRQSGGHVAIESTVGAGTTVTIYLPRAEGAIETAGESGAGSGPQAAAVQPPPVVDGPAAAPASLPSGSETVLVVEDEPMVRAYVAAELHRLGYRVVEARDGREAMAALHADPAIRLLFTDMVMPGGMRGNELARQARAIRPSLKILFTTGYANAFDGKTPPDDETITVLRKPYPRRDLAEYVRRCLDAA